MPVPNWKGARVGLPVVPCAVCASPVAPTRRFCSTACADLRRAVTAQTWAARKRGRYKAAYLDRLRDRVAAGEYRVPTGLVVDGILTWHGRDGFLTDDDCRVLLEGVSGAEPGGE